jgi:molecular chaperone GrpE
MTRDPDTLGAVNNGPRSTQEGAPHGAPKPSKPAVDPEPPVTPVSSLKSESAAPQPDEPDGAEAQRAQGSKGAQGSKAAQGADGADGTAAKTDDHERQLEHDIEQLTAKAEKAEEYLELAQRTRADFENYRKRAAREAAAAQERGIAKLAKELLPAVDNLDRALEAAQAATATPGQGAPAQDNGATTLVDGIKLVHSEVINALARAGIERFSPEGERFDPQEHEAIAQLPAPGKESGTVVEVYQRGYRLGEVVIRPARVVVAA